MEENHTAANIAQRLGEVADAYEIPGCKKVAVVHDNAANMVLCADILEQEEEGADVKGVRCNKPYSCASTPLSNKTPSVAPRLQPDISWLNLRREQKPERDRRRNRNNKKGVEHLLIQDVSTRWNYSQTMLERLLEQKWPVTAVLSERYLHLTTAQWNMAEDILNVLKPMVTLTELLSEEANASLSATISIPAKLKRRHLAVVEDDSPTTNSGQRRWRGAPRREVDRLSTALLRDRQAHSPGRGWAVMSFSCD
ncbi:unnamed protein product [Coregonus sp. 'balchen']|nr:unnamed protein product [Coregonus sp. 'balchen']